ncbi:hypothetical protein FAES_4048 [Fibrella aestuarina BUZ 2]|uniref:Uncharacterized protein n=1 Tax=Fibrella aestuarina BUZ 2 TaxID=1166018 RepID=I0KD45_9BACT|nr:hypothetical protein [Fibrella aestuarina]CCH02048.1 hypothetical protein FAES_4048 [Fibrella aestuarina BUZ 2]
MQQYFIKKGTGNAARNNLERVIVDQLERFDQVLTDDPKVVSELMRDAVEKCNRRYPRCKPATFVYDTVRTNSSDYQAYVRGLGGSRIWEAKVYHVTNTLLAPKEPPAHIPVPPSGRTTPGEQLSFL